MNILPLPGQCLVEILPHTATGPIIIPDSATMKDGMGKLPPVRGIVRKLGRWPQKSNGYAVLPEISPGDAVLLSQYAGQKLHRLGDRFRLVRIADVLAILK
jgi:co-chaperonin GroES (HSP10)